MRNPQPLIKKENLTHEVIEKMDIDQLKQKTFELGKEKELFITTILQLKSEQIDLHKKLNNSSKLIKENFLNIDERDKIIIDLKNKLLSYNSNMNNNENGENKNNENKNIENLKNNNLYLNEIENKLKFHLQEIEINKTLLITKQKESDHQKEIIKEKDETISKLNENFINLENKYKELVENEKVSAKSIKSLQMSLIIKENEIGDLTKRNFKLKEKKKSSGFSLFCCFKGSMDDDYGETVNLLSSNQGIN
jgi:hypothetical protein